MKFFLIFRLNFSWDVSKMRNFNNKFSKIAKHWGFCVPMQRPINLRFWWRKVSQILVFQIDYDKIELLKISYDVISVTSSLLLHQYDTKTMSQNFSVLGPSQSKFLLRQCVTPIQYTKRNLILQVDIFNKLTIILTPTCNACYDLETTKTFFQEMLFLVELFKWIILPLVWKK